MAMDDIRDESESGRDAEPGGGNILPSAPEYQREATGAVEADTPGGEAARTEAREATVDKESHASHHGKSAHHREDATRKHARKELKEALERSEEAVAKLSKEVETLQCEAKDLKDKWLRSAAEFENYRKRIRKEWELLQQRTKAEIILDVLAVVDDFERAFAVAGDRDDDFIRGIRLIYNNLHASLEKIGVRKIEALHAAFDPAYHMAVAQMERDGADSNHVIEIVQEGYCLGDIVVRPAKVVIAK
jgi:molecular chaperone GrpE